VRLYGARRDGEPGRDLDVGHALRHELGQVPLGCGEGFPSGLYGTVTGPQTSELFPASVVLARHPTHVITAVALYLLRTRTRGPVDNPDVFIVHGSAASWSPVNDDEAAGPCLI
jgi:hypothetical protein